MRSTALAVMVALVAPVLAAQQATVKSAAAPGDLDAELHYPTGQNGWIATNKPAYVALFEVSRSGVAQIYPTFSAQAEYPTGSQRRAIDIPYANLFGGSLRSSLAGLHAATLQDGGWPRMFLLVASTSPLRVGSPWMTEISLNHDLLRQHHVDDLQTDSGIEALVDLVKPLDPDAEVAFDRLDGIRSATAQVASIADANLSHTSYLGYYCSTQWQPGSSYFAMAAIDGGLCSFVVPARQSVAANVQPDAAAKASATRAVSQTRSITNPAAIQLYMDGFRSAQLTNGMSNSAGGFSSASTLTFGHGGSMERGSAATNTAAPAASTSGAARSSKP